MNPPSPIEKRTPMSSAQRRLYLQCQLPGGDRAYHLLYLARVRGPFPLAGARAFANRMMERHESLRTAFRMENGEFIAEVYRKVDLAFTVIDGKETDLERIVEAHDTPFELAVPPLLRVVILRLGEADCILIFDCHHLIFDGYSGGILDRDILDTLSGRELAPPERAYSDFVEWENRFFQSAAYGEQRDFWCRQYRDAPKRLTLPLDFPAPAAKSFAGDYFIRYLESKGPKAFSMSQGTTLFTTLLAAFYCVLYKLTGQEEMTVGTLVSPRESGHFQNVIGLFANTLPLTQFLDPKTPFSAFLQKVRIMVLQATQHAEFPFEHLIRQLPFLEKGVRNPLFDVVFNFERVARRRAEPFGDVTVEPLDYYAKVSMFDFAVDLVEYEDQVRFRVEYGTALFRRETLQGLMDAYFGILRQVCRAPDIPLGDLSLVSEETHGQLLRWNDTARALKKDRTFLDTWKEAVGLHADNPALRLNGREVTYAGLEERANRLADHLVDSGIGPGSVVGVAMDRSPEGVIALLALWKAGAVYLPLAASHPPKRIMHQLADSRAVLVITKDRLRENFAGFCRIITPDAPDFSMAACPKNEPGREIHPEQPAYIIYTSGSTGTPKGVIVDHRAVYAHIDAVKGIYRIESDDNVLQFSSPTFDASLEQILVALAGGACLVLLDSGLQDPRALLDLLVSEEITVAEFPPAYLKELLPVLTPCSFERIRRLVSGGDVLTPSLAREITKYLPAEARLLNFYGPTEATMAATVYPVAGNLEPYASWPSVPIGRPLPNTRIYILDRHLQPLPVGIQGELCIAGDRLARGYLNREALTEEKFVQTELLGKAERVYKTGDRARWLPDGNIEFLGRLDRQVQLRGYRIELGEIEQVLRRHPEVRDAAVIKKGDPGECLAAFVVPRSQGALSARPMYEWLKEYLPDYMIPSTFTFSDAIPRNAEGKVDRQALTVSVGCDPVSVDETPLDALEWDLWHMWRKILKWPHIGRNDVFFQIGGNSLSAIQVMVEVKNKYNAEIPLSLLLRAPTIAILADFLRNTGKTVSNSCVVSLNPEGTGPPIVLIPGLGGNVLDLYELSTRLDKRFPCYGLQHPWDSEKSGVNGSIEDLARYYLHELDAVTSPEGCILLGHSFGGYVAYELARLLQERGRPPQSLLLLDLVAPKGDPTDRRLPLTDRDLLFLTARSLLGSHDDDAAGGTPEVPAEVGDEYEKVLEVLKSANRLPRSLSADQFRRCMETIGQRAAAFSRYEPASVVDANIVLFRALEIDPTQGFRREDGNWADWTGGSFELRWAAGGHFSMIKGGHASDLAEQIHSHISTLDRVLKNPLSGQAVQKCLDARRAKTSRVRRIG